MATQSEVIMLQLREMLMRGDFESGQHLQEIQLAKMLDTSRTPVRLALAALAQEGLLIYKPQRGFLVRKFTIEEISDAIEVRGELEAMACRLVAERGLSDETLKNLTEAVDQMREIGEEKVGYVDYSKWFDLNGLFHRTIVQASGNQSIEATVIQLGKIPLAGAGALAATIDNLERIKLVVKKSQIDHENILDALSRRQSARARALMCEHVFQSMEGQRRHLNSLRSGAEGKNLPVLNLVAQT